LTNCFEQLQHVLETIPNDGVSTQKGKVETTKERKDKAPKHAEFASDEDIKKMINKQSNIQKTLDITTEMIVQNDIEV
jgi:hypothetical protein